MKVSFSVISDIDGVLHRGSKVVPGARRFVSELRRSGRNYLFLTNSSDYTPDELHRQIRKMGMDIPADRFYTTAHAIADFLVRDQKHPRVHVIGSKALHDEIKHRGGRITSDHPDFVVVTATDSFKRAQIDETIGLIQKGGRFISSNNDALSLTETGANAGNGILISPIAKATGCCPYIVGKPNHLMIRAVEEKFGIDPRRTLMIGDSLETDVDVGIQAGMTTILVLSGVTTQVQLDKSAYRPTYVFPNLAKVNLSKLP